MSYKNLKGRKIKFNDEIIELNKYIDSGGNSFVYDCTYQNEKFVIKFFNAKNLKRYERFKQEVEKINCLNEKEDFTPKVIVSYFPECDYKKLKKLKNEEAPFYVMEKGQEYDYGSLSFVQKIEDIIEIASKLKYMHNLNIQHRDIKPQNIIRYKNHLTFIDYGTACVPGIKTIDADERKGSIDTIAPEMNEKPSEIPDYKYEFADIYSLGKTIWIILNNNIFARKFTTYNATDEISKLKIQQVPEGIVKYIESLLTNVTNTNYFDRMSLDEIINVFMTIKDKLLNNSNNCNIVKFKCILGEITSPKYDLVLIHKEEKIKEFIRNISDIGIQLSLEENDKEVCNSIYQYFTIQYGKDYYYFSSNNIKFIFHIKEIIISQEEIIIKTNEYNQMVEYNTKKFNNLDSFSKVAILTTAVDENIENIIIECEIHLKLLELN